MSIDTRPEHIADIKITPAKEFKSLETQAVRSTAAELLSRVELPKTDDEFETASVRLVKDLLIATGSVDPKTGELLTDTENDLADAAKNYKQYANLDENVREDALSVHDNAPEYRVLRRMNLINYLSFIVPSTIHGPRRSFQNKSTLNWHKSAERLRLFGRARDILGEFYMLQSKVTRR